MNLLKLLLGVTLLANLFGCQLLGMDEREGTIVYDVDIPPNPVPSISISPTTFSMNENGGSQTITVSIGAQPMTNGSVIVEITNPNTSRISASPSYVTFTNSSYGDQTVTLSGIDNFIADGNVVLDIPVSSRGSDWRFAGLARSLSATIIDDDIADFTITETSGTSVTEAGSTDTFTVVLNTLPQSNIGLTVTSTDTTEATVSPATLTFTSGNWNSPQTVTVTGVDDLVQDGNGSTPVTLAIDPGITTDAAYLAIANKTVTATTTDDDVANFTITETAGSTAVTEMGGTDTVTVVLTSQPTANVILDITSTDTGEVTVSPAQLTFSSGNYTTPQTVTFTGIDDFIDDGNLSTTITFSPNGSTGDPIYAALSTQNLAVSNTDNDSAGITATETGANTVVGENGDTDMFSVELDTEPVGNVVLSLSISDTTEATFVTSIDNDSGDVTSTSNTLTLTFTSSDWDTRQDVTLVGVDDDIDDDNVSITSIVSIDTVSTLDSQYDLLGSITVPVIVTDNDSAGFIIAETGSNTRVYETGATDTYTVVLTTEPTNTVVLSVTSATTTEVTATTTSFTFNAGNWNVPQTGTVTGVDDVAADGNTTNTVTISVDTINTLDNVYDLVLSQNLSVINNDDDVVGITVDPAFGILIDETGTTDTFTVVLDSQPTGNVIIDVTSPDTGEMTVSPAQLTFTMMDWNTPQTVTLTGVDDDIDDGTINVNISNAPNGATADAAYAALGAVTVVASTRDNDTAGIVLATTGGNNSVTEPNTTDTFTLVLTSEPTSSVVLDITSSDTSEVTVPASITFTTGNWNSAQTVTMTAADDANVDGTQTSTITVSVDQASTVDTVYDAVDNVTTTVTTTDDEALGITLTSTAETIAEGGTAVVGVSLDAQPSGNVVLDLTPSNPNEVSIDTSSMTFNAGNWNVAQNVTITAINDSLDDGNTVTTVDVIVNTSSTADSTWLAVPDANVTVTATDDDVSGITVGTNVTVTEAGSTGIIGVVLNARPTDVVVIDIAEDDADNSEITLSDTSFTFNPAAWNVTQNLVVTGLDDEIQDGNSVTNLTFTINTGSTLDSIYDAVGPEARTATTTDDDVVGFSFECCSGDGAGVSGNRMIVLESGGSNTFTVVLNSQPTNNVQIDVTPTSTLTVDTGTLTFTNGNWDTPQAVTVSAVQDNVYQPQRQGTITLDTNNTNTLDNNFDPVASQSLLVRFDGSGEDDVRGITINQGDGLAVDETGITDTFTVVMNIPPFTGQNAVFDVTSANTGEITVSPAQLTFTDGDWNSPQTVTITGVDDGPLADGDQTVNITIASNAASTDNYWDSIISETVTGENADNDNVAVNVIETGGGTTVNEDGTTDTVLVSLASSVGFGSQVVVNVSVTGADATASPATLTFTSMDWNVNQTVTVSAVDDGLANGSRVNTLNLAVDTNAFNTTDAMWAAVGPSATANINVLDDDNAAITVDCCGTAGSGSGTNSGNRVSIAENGGTDTFTVVLTSEPISNVILDIASGSPNDLSTNTLQLTFTPANWNTTQTVTMTGVNDDIDGDDNVDNTTTIAVNGSTADANYSGLATQSVFYRVPDDDTAGYTLSTTTINVSENVTVSSFTVVLDTEPVGNVEFDLTNPDTTEAALSVSSLLFTAGDWNTPQTVNVTGVNDDDDDGDITFNVTLAIDAPNTNDAKYDLLGSTNISVTNVDNDDGARVTLATDVGGASEAGGVVTIQANQDIVAGVDTTVTIGVTGGTASAGEYSLASSNITISSGTLQGTTTLTMVDDNVDEGTETITVEITAVAGGGGAVEDGTQSVTLNVNDDDTAGFSIAETGGSTTVTEGGGTDTFTIVLASLPTGNVRLDLTADDATEITVSPVGILFTTGNWNTPQTVTVTPVQDIVEDGAVTANIDIAINTSVTADSIYDTVSSQSLDVTVNDDDSLGIANFSMTSITRDFSRLELNWNAPASGFDTSTSSSDSYLLYYTTVAPINRTPSGRLVDETDNKTSAIRASKTKFIHGPLNSANTYYYRVAAVDSSGDILFSTNELSGSPYPIECSTTSGFLTDNDADLLVYYPFEGDYTDKSSANGRSASDGWPFDLEVAPEAGNISFSDGCAYGRAIYFDGAGCSTCRNKGSFLSNTDFTNDDIGTSFTISLWTQPDGDMEQYAAVFSSGPDSNGPQFQIDVNDAANPIGNIRVFDRRVATNTAQGDILQIGAWYHIVMVHDGTDNSVRLYQNGVYKDDGANFLYECNASTSPQCEPTRRIFEEIIIARNRQGREKWKGFIDEVKIYNRAFTQSEVTALYNLSLPPAPENAVAASVGDGTADIRITWNAVASATSYTLYRVENSFADVEDSIRFENANLDVTGSNITAITNVQAGCTTGTCTYTDNDAGLVFNRYYNYRIASVNAIGTGNPGPITEVNAQAL